MKIIFSHQNFPAQFGEFAFFLARAGWDVTFATAATAKSAGGVRILPMKPHREPTEGVHRFTLPMERAAINGQGFARSALAAQKQGYVPDVVMAHAGWGSGTFAKAVWPDVKFVSYAEWFYRYPYVDAMGEPDERPEVDQRGHALSRNAPLLLDLVQADQIQCPSLYQADQFPEPWRSLLTVMPDGLDAVLHAPAESPTLPDAAGTLPPDAEIVTYATRGMEPHRGFPEFMRALEILQKRRPKLHAVIGGEDRVAYGRKLGEGDSWKTRMLRDLDLDESRLHWTGLLPRGDYVRLLQAGHVHAYLTVPFVLSWSLLEAMSVGCTLVCSDVPPVREAAEDGVEALLIDHRAPEAVADAIARALDDRELAARLGQAARARILRDHDRRWVFPARARMLADLVRGGPTP